MTRRGDPSSTRRGDPRRSQQRTGEPQRGSLTWSGLTLWRHPKNGGAARQVARLIPDPDHEYQYTAMAGRWRCERLPLGEARALCVEYANTGKAPARTRRRA